MLYEELFRKLAEEDVEYVVVGGVALVLHGVIRLTADLDLFVELSEPNLTRFIHIMKEMGYKPKAPVRAEDFIKPEERARWKEEKGMIVFSFFHPRRPMDLIDVFTTEPLPYDEIRGNKKVVEARGIRIPIVSADQLKQLKRIAGRPQDLADIEALEEIEGD